MTLAVNSTPVISSTIDEQYHHNGRSHRISLFGSAMPVIGERPPESPRTRRTSLGINWSRGSKSQTDLSATTPTTPTKKHRWSRAHRSNHSTSHDLNIESDSEVPQYLPLRTKRTSSTSPKKTSHAQDDVENQRAASLLKLIGADELPPAIIVDSRSREPLLSAPQPHQPTLRASSEALSLASTASTVVVPLRRARATSAGKLTGLCNHPSFLDARRFLLEELGPQALQRRPSVEPASKWAATETEERELWRALHDGVLLCR